MYHPLSVISLTQNGSFLCFFFFSLSIPKFGEPSPCPKVLREISVLVLAVVPMTNERKFFSPTREDPLFHLCNGPEFCSKDFFGFLFEAYPLVVGSSLPVTSFDFRSFRFPPVAIGGSTSFRRFPKELSTVPSWRELRTFAQGASLFSPQNTTWRANCFPSLPPLDFFAHCDGSLREETFGP